MSESYNDRRVLSNFVQPHLVGVLRFAQDGEENEKPCDAYPLDVSSSHSYDAPIGGKLRFFILVLLWARLGFAACDAMGPIPTIDCKSASPIPSFHAGKRVTWENGKYFLDGVAAPFAKLQKVDTPNLATPGSVGGLNARLGHLFKNGIDWVFICRQEEGAASPDAYQFKPIGLIGFREPTGETCFTDINNNVGGPSNLPDPSNETSYCVGCHNNNSPYLFTPYLQQSALGGENETFPGLSPEKKRKPGWGYWVHDLSEADRKSHYGVQPKNPDGSADMTCTSCHTISDGVKALVKDASGAGEGPWAKTAFAQAFPQSHWMPPFHGASSLQEWQANYQPAVNRLLHCLDQNDLKRCFPRQELLVAPKTGRN